MCYCDEAPEDCTYDAIKNDVFALGQTLAYIWTHIHTEGKAPCSALGSEWDGAVAQSDEHGPMGMYMGQQDLLEEYMEKPYYHSLNISATALQYCAMSL